MLFDPCDGLDEVHGVVVVFLDAGCDRKDIRIEDDVLGREAGPVHQNVVAAFADFGLAFKCIRLALLVKCHHHRRSTVSPDQSGMFDERFFTFLEADGVDDRFPLHALESGFDHVPFGRIDHQRHARDIRLGGEQIDELCHRGFGIQHRLVHVDVNDLRAIFNLLARDADRFGILAVQDQTGEHFRTGHVGTLADIHEQRATADVEWFQPGQPQPRIDDRGFSRRHILDRFGDRPDVGRRGTTATASDIEETACGECLNQPGRLVRLFVVARVRQWVGQTGIRVRAHIT